jgi:hypothetical protein
MIQAIPLSCTNQEDVLIWRGTKNGAFYVKRTYHLQKEIVNQNLAECLNNGENNSVWKRQWTLREPNGENNFLWHASSDILPTRENLCEGKILTNPMCPLCDLEVESRFHIRW